MRKIFFVFGFVLFTTIISAQPWLSKLPQDKSAKELTLFDYQKAFNDYWAPFNVKNGYYYLNGIKYKAIGWKQFHRWEWDNENQVDHEGRFPQKTAQQVYDEYSKIKPALSRTEIANWTNLGTNSSNGGYAGIGRINCIAFHPTDQNTFWVGTPSGGLWVTKDNGQSWTCLTDRNKVLGISDILVPTDYATSNTIYIATGDKDAWDNRSVGVLKSTNAGNSWDTTGLTFSLADDAMVTRMLLDPTNNQTILAATTKGVYKTTNGGTTWNTQLTSKSFIDMEYKPGDFNTLYGSSQSGGIYLSKNGGVKWTQIMFLSNGARTELAVSPNQPTWVYALASGTDKGLYGIYKSTNSGSGYSQIFDGNISGNNLLGWSSYGGDSTGQGWYDLTIDASPSNANTVVVGGINTWRSTDGGSSWSIINHWWGDGAQAVHADKHSLKFRNNGDLFECNDGGVYFSDNNGNDFSDITNGIVSSQMYRLGVSQTIPNEIITGLQDNGTKLFSFDSWSDVLGGDGMECLIDYTEANTQYASIYYGDIHRTTDHWGNSTGIKPPNAGDGAWITPYIIDPKNHKTLYAGFKEVWKTMNQGDSWTQISQLNISDKLLSMAISSFNTNFICVATSTKIWKTIDGGTNWIEITGNLPTNSAKITSIEIERSSSKIWVSMGGYVNPGVYESANGDTIWNDISAGLPQIPVYSVIQNDQDTSGDQLYAGTELGVYLKTTSDNWRGFNSKLPNVKIGELDIYYAPKSSDSKIRAATYGRGLWESNLFIKDAPMTFVSLTTTQKNISSVAPAKLDADILCYKIETENVLKPFKVNQLSLSIDGTSDTSDVANIKIYYTASDSVFAPINQFGLSASPTAGIITINGSQTLVPGNNYFWIAYDLKSSATVGHFIDAKGLSVTIDSILRIPADTNPAGARIISKQYCAAGSLATDYEYISNVAVGPINNQMSEKGMGGYEDYTSRIMTIHKPSYNNITVSVTDPLFSDQLLIWIDWNMDAIFSDTAERVYVSATTGSYTYVANVLPPVDALLGITRMRIRLHNTTSNANYTPCGFSANGEVEDYTVDVVPTVGTPSFIKSRKILLYPNPVLNQLNVEIEGSSEKIRCEILNSMGQKVFSSNLNGKTSIDMTQFSDGFYLIKFETGGYFLYRKFVKE